MKILFRRNSKVRRIGDQHRNAAEWRLAAAAYGAHLADNPHDGPIWVQLGHVEKEAGDLDAAEAAYRRAAGLMPQDTDVLLHLGHLLKRQSRKADALDTFRALFRLQPEPAILQEVRDLITRPGQQIAGQGVLAFALEDFFQSLEKQSAAGRIQQVQMAVVKAAMADPALDVLFFVQDEAERDADVLFSLDKQALGEIIDYVSRGAVDHRILQMLLAEARLSAVPLSLRSGCTIVHLGLSLGEGIGIAGYLKSLRRGVRLVLLAPDNVLSTPPQPRDATSARLFWRRLAEMVYAADLILTDSDRLRAELDHLLPRGHGRDIPVRTISWAQDDRAVGISVIDAIRQHVSTSGSVRAAPPVLLRDGWMFDPGAFPAGDELSNPISLALAESFYEAEPSGAWLRGNAGELTFRTTAAPGETIVVFLRIGPPPGPPGGRLSVSFATSRGSRRWLEPSADGDLIRLEGVVDPDGECTLLFAYDGELQKPKDDPRLLGIALKAIGYARRTDAISRLKLREQFIFGSAA